MEKKHSIDPISISSQDLYKILIGSVLPRPIAWVSSKSKEGINNLAPFSFFTIASVKPPVLCFAPAMKGARPENASVGGPKDTLNNIRDTKEFVVNIVSRSLVEPMNQTSYDYPPDVSEFVETGMSPIPSLKVQPPRVGESLINIECKLFQLIEIGTEPQGGTLILGEIVHLHIDERVITDYKIDMDVLDPIGRLGGLWYSGIKDRFELPRPKAGNPIKSL
ncbi:MAG: flavin reductase family protein [Chloroherpetonaceae bacterium]|nr:flavin reductase family protein [Chloroherpetonaceae bacterium]